MKSTFTKRPATGHAAGATSPGGNAAHQGRAAAQGPGLPDGRDELAPLWQVLPHLPEIVAAWDGATVREVAERFSAPGAAPSAAVVDAMCGLAAESMGTEVAQGLRSRLARTPSVLSANHHGIECFPALVQALHFFGLAELLPARSPDGPSSGPAPGEGAHPLSGQGAAMPSGLGVGGAHGAAPAGQTAPRGVIPVLSCTTVALQSQVYPRGLLLSRRVARDGHLVRLPLFPATEQDTVVAAAPALAAQGVAAMRRRWRQVRLARWEREAVNALVDMFVDRPEVYELPSFERQVSHINERMCRARFPDSHGVSVAYMGLETLASRVLQRDLTDAGTPVARMLFDGALRRGLLDALAGTRACWERTVFEGAGDSLPRTGRSGTAFFWWLDDAGRRCPLRCVADADGAALVREGVRIPLAPEPLVQALGEGRLVPGLFCSYMALVVGHGLHCHGGVFFASYLPAMLAGLARVPGLGDLARSVPHGLAGPDLLAELPLTVFLDDGHEPPRAAGAVELLAGGGLTAQRLEQLAALPMRDVLPYSLRECYMEFVPEALRERGWEERMDAAPGEGCGVFLSCR